MWYIWMYFLSLSQITCRIYIQPVRRCIIRFSSWWHTCASSFEIIWQNIVLHLPAVFRHVKISTYWLVSSSVSGPHFFIESTCWDCFNPTTSNISSKPLLFEIKRIQMSRLMTKPTKWRVRPAKTQISLGIRPVWSASSLCAQWIAKDTSFLHADSEDSG